MAAVLLVAALGAGGVGFPGQTGWPIVVVLCCASVLPALGALAAYRLGLVREGREGLAWKLVGVALAQMVPIYVLDYLGADTLEAVFVALTYGFGALAILWIPHPRSGPYDRTIALLDALGLGIVVATGTFWLLSGTGVATSGELYHAIGDAAVMAMAGYVAVRRSQQGIDWQIVWLVLGVAATLGGNLTMAVSDTPYTVGHPADFSFLAGMAAFALAPLVMPPVQDAPRVALEPGRWQRALVPYTVVALLAAAIVSHVVSRWDTDPMSVAIGLGALAAMIVVLLRQLAIVAQERRRVMNEQQGVIATVSHELRTPLTSIVGFLDLLEDWEAFTEDEKLEMINLIRAQSHVLARVVGDLVAVARRQMDRVDVTRENLSTHEIVATAIALVPEADTQHIEVDIADGVTLTADPARIVQVIGNFFANAAHYGSGHIEVIAYNDADATVIEVHDNGSGVPEVYQLIIWERFERAAQRQGTIPGSGIGLAVARGVARSHGGETYYRRSERLGGACFSIRVPLDYDVLRNDVAAGQVGDPAYHTSDRSF